MKCLNSCLRNSTAIIIILISTPKLGRSRGWQQIRGNIISQAPLLVDKQLFGNLSDRLGTTFHIYVSSIKTKAT